MNNHDLAMKAARRIVNEMGSGSPVDHMAAIIQETYGSQQPRETPAPEPERPEPKFQQWQWVNWWDEDNDTGTARITAEPEWNGREWLYTAEVVADATGPLGEPDTDVLGERTNTLSPHAMTIDDVPPETMHAITHGKPVQVVKHPVDHKGVPREEDDPAGTVVTIADLTGLDGDDGQPVAKPDDAGMFWPWNLEVAED